MLKQSLLSVFGNIYLQILFLMHILLQMSHAFVLKEILENPPTKI